MWPGPYGDFGSRKYLISSLDQSLQRMGLEYVDIFYHHRPDPETSLEETMGALDHIVRSGKALYVGISAYSAEDTKKAAEILRDLGTPLLIHQPEYNMYDRWIENGLLTVLQDEGIGCIVFSPLAQGLLTERYLNGIPADSRAAGPVGFLTTADIQPDRIRQVSLLTEIAHKRGQSMAQMALAWNLRLPGVTSVLVGASSVKQIEENINTLKNLEFSNDELQRIDQIIGKPQEK
jgi:L-glyceraldehyde 3-phosphate reductase